MHVTLLYFEGCPNWRSADAQLAEALGRLGRDDVAVTRQRVESEAEAERLGFRGSPTILIDGEDPFSPTDAPVGLSCRAYSTAEGLAGAPTVAQLMEALE